MRLSTTEVRDVSPAGAGARAGLVSRLHRRANKRARHPAGGAQIILPPASHPRRASATHVIRVCVAMATARAVHDISTCAAHLRPFKLNAPPPRAGN